MKIERLLQRLRSKKACAGCLEEERLRGKECRTEEIKRRLNKLVPGRRCGRKWFPEHE